MSRLEDLIVGVRGGDYEAYVHPGCVLLVVISLLSGHYYIKHTNAATRKYGLGSASEMPHLD
ncbi:hypothetical protein BJX76DRAFT_334564 [Aspergillus varians]